MSQESTALWTKLQAPFDWADVQIKVQSVSKDKTKALPVIYFDSRAVRRRLNEVFGPDGWNADYREVYEEAPIFGKDGKVISPQAKRLIGVVCKIEVRMPDGGRAVREDVGIPTDIEPIKGAYSDAIKRAFAAFGNDHLYHIELGWHPITDNKFRPFLPAVIDRIRKMYEEQVRARSETEASIEQIPESYYEEPTAGNGSRAQRVADKLGVAPHADDVDESLNFDRYDGPVVAE